MKLPKQPSSLGRILSNLHFSSTRLWLRTALTLAICWISVMVLPIIGSFGYAYAVIAAVPSGLLALFAGFELGIWLRNTRIRHSQVPQPARSLWLHAALSQAPILLAAVLPALVGAASGAVCDVPATFTWLFWLPGLSFVLFLTLGLGAGARWPNTRLLRIGVPAGIYLLLVLWGIIEFYNRPAVYSYNLPVGYFSGQLYDASKGIPAPLLSSRLIELLAALGIFTLALPSLLHRAPQIKQWLLAMTLLTASAYGFLNRHQYDVSFTAEQIASELGGRHQTKNFTFIYPADASFADDIALIAQDAEFRLHQVQSRLGIELTRPITAFYFASPDQKARFMGARNVYMAKPWRYEIYLNHQDFPHPVLRHEIAHIVAGEVTDNLFHASVRPILGLPLQFNVGLIEGIAVAADWPGSSSDFTPHETTAAAISLGARPSLTKLMGSGFFSVNSHTGYSVAGSFVKFLLDTKGASFVARAYQKGSIAEAELETLERQWVDYLEKHHTNPQAAKILEETLRRPGVLTSRCRDWEFKTRRDVDTLIRKRKLDRALSLTESLCQLDPKRSSFLRTKAEIHLLAGRLDQAQMAIEPLRNTEIYSSVTVSHAREFLARIEFERGNRKAAETHLISGLNLALPRYRRRALQVLSHLVHNQTPANTAALSLFWSDRRTTGGSQWLAISGLLGAKDPVIQYLVARNTLTSDTARLLAPVLQQVMSELPFQDLRDEALRLATRASFLAGDLSTADVLGQLLERHSSAILAAEGREWRQRIKFMLSPQ